MYLVLLLCEVSFYIIYVENYLKGKSTIYIINALPIMLKFKVQFIEKI